VYIGILASNGEQYLPTSEVNDKGGIYADSLAQAFGLQDGDKILNVNGKEVADFYRIMETVVFEKAEYIEVERQGQRVKVELPDEAISMLLAQTENRFINVRVPFIVDSILVNSPAYASGFKKGDQILGIDSITTLYFQDYVREKNAFKDQDVTIVVKRNDEILNIPTHLNEEGNLGVFSALPSNYFEFKTVDYSLLEAIPAGTKKTFTEISDYWKQLKLIFQPETKAYESVGGFISIGKIFPESFQWLVFWRLTAFLSIALAVMNILPIPALDGGHILFLIVEMITRRKPSDKFMEIAETIGLFLVLALLIFANGNDIIKLFR
ncbi:MAG: site-2 protease family protein, partial [Bacteroidales bacterium]|nr:site-2 protease family protein [Bacteroidales bacterium]